MGCCVCCFGSCQPISCAISGLIITAISFGFLIWGVADMVWPNSGARATYIIGFVALILILVGFIGMLIILFVRNSTGNKDLNLVGKVIAIIVLVLGGIALVCLIIAEIILIAKYADAESVLNDYDAHIPGRWWACALVPGIMSIILIPIALKAANALLQIFSKGINCPLNEYVPPPITPAGPGGITINATNVTIGQDKAASLGLNPNNPIISLDTNNIQVKNNQLNNGQI